MPNPRSTPRSILVLCPMAVEYKAVARAVRQAGLDSVRVVQTGVGRHAILAALERDFAGTRPSDLVILAGLCGALSTVEDIPPIARAVDEHGGMWPLSGAGDRGVSLIGVDRIISTPGDKRTLAQATGAAIVDMEAHVFAAACESRSVRWCIVRGVSDTPDETLPREVLNWIAPDGSSRPFRAAVDVIRSPSLIPHVLGFVRRASRVLPRIGARVCEVIVESNRSLPADSSQIAATAPVGAS